MGTRKNKMKYKITVHIGNKTWTSKPLDYDDPTNKVIYDRLGRNIEDVKTLSFYDMNDKYIVFPRDTFLNSVIEIEVLSD